MAIGFLQHHSTRALKAAALAALGALLYLFFRGPGEPFATRSDTDQQVHLGEEIGAGRQELTLCFWDGTELSLLPTSRALVTALDEHATRVEVREGPIQARVAKESGVNLMLRVGPYQLYTKQATFDVAWDERRGWMTVRVRRGQVTVEGDETATGIVASLRPGVMHHFDRGSATKPRREFVREYAR